MARRSDIPKSGWPIVSVLVRGLQFIADSNFSKFSEGFKDYASEVSKRYMEGLYATTLVGSILLLASDALMLGIESPDLKYFIAWRVSFIVLTAIGLVFMRFSTHRWAINIVYFILTALGCWFVSWLISSISVRWLLYSGLHYVPAAILGIFLPTGWLVACLLALFVAFFAPMYMAYDWSSIELSVLLQSAIFTYTVALLANRLLFGILHVIYEQRKAITEEFLGQLQVDIRGRVAKDLHDQLGQNLAALKVLSEESDNQPLREKTQFLLKDISEYIKRLRPPEYTRVRLIDALRLTVQEFSDSFSGNVIKFFDNKMIDFDAAKYSDLILIVREACTNILKHAQASEASIQILVDQRGISATILDNGIGSGQTEEQNSTGLGLESMRERAENLGGSITIETSPDQGTLVRVDVPL